MRTMFIASAGVALMMAAGASAEQRVVGHGPGVALRMVPHNGTWRAPNGTPPAVHMGGSRWGSNVGGHWWGGANAPGGWQAYRRPARGYVLPSYWINPRFYVTDWSFYGLTPPTVGYNWVRYYDDAVLIDGRGSVYDVADGIDWDRADDGYYTDDTRVYAGSAERGYRQSYAPAPEQPVYRQRREGSDGVAGAVVGGVIGGVAGNLIGGKGNRLGGTLIGAGVGAAAGYAVDRGSRQHRDYREVPVAPEYAAPDHREPYGADYREPIAPPPPPIPPRAPYPPHGGSWTSNNGGTSVTTTTTGGYAAGGYYYPAGSTTTVVVQQAPVVTTTTTEIYEDTVTYVKPRARRTKIVKRWRAPAKCSCR